MDTDFKAEKQLLRKQAEARLTKTARSIENFSLEEIKALIHDYQVHRIELELQNEELRTAQAALEESRERYFELYDLAPAGYVTLSETGLILEANLTAATLLGETRHLLVKQPIHRFILKEDQDTYYLHRRNLFDTGEPQECDLRLVRSDGTDFWAHLSATVAQDHDKTLMCRVVINDISDRKRASEILIRAKEEQFENVFHASPIGIAVYDEQGAMQSMNKAFREIYGIRVKTIKGVSLFDDPFLSRKSRQRLLTGRAIREEMVFDCTHTAAREVYKTTKTGILYLDVQITPFGSDLDPAVTGYMVQVQDISARKDAEEAQRLLSGQLILAHEDERRMISRELHDGVGQDLMAVKIGLDELIQRRADICPEVREKIAVFSRLTGQAVADIRDLAYEQHPFGLEIYGFTQSIVQHVKEFSDKSGIIVNLSLAGVDDLILGGDIGINLYRLIQEGLRNSQKHAQAQRIDVKVVKSLARIILRVEDDGIGFEPLSRMTSAVAEKRMGLRSMHERATLLGGTMHVRSKPGKGTKILVELPITVSSDKEAA